MLLGLLKNLSKNKKNQVSLIYLSTFYFLLYFIYLVKCRYIPYVFDNNETFSSLTHARNMVLFGFKSTFGLTDETFSLSPSAHPFVYTHQGNFPRFYSYLLYQLGFQSFGWQVALTTFTVGFAGLVMCHKFISKNISILFSIVFCTLLMTDYIMFSQWQVNTWRVWQFFFFFSSFICSQKIIQSKNRWFIPLTIINFMCLAYTEISFATFVTISCFIYSFCLTNNKKIIFLNAVIIGTGFTFGLTILIIQNIAYMGWESFILDLKYTFNARNSIKQNEVQQISKFFHDHKIVFWENFNSINNLRNPINILQLFYRYCLLPYSPFLNFFIFSTFIISFIQKNKSFFNNIQINNFRLSSLFMNKKINYFLFVLLIIFLIITNGSYILKQINPVKVEDVLICIIVTYAIYLLYKNSTKSTNDLKYILTAVPLIITYLLINFLNNKNIIFSHELTLLTSQQFQIKFLYLFIFLIFIYHTYYNINISNQLKSLTFSNVSNLFFSCFLGFLITFFLLPGYILSGYLLRYCCFTVYAHMLIYAWFAYELLFSLKNTDFRNKNLLSKVNQFAIPFLLLLVFSVTWYNLQISYIREFKPNHFTFIKNLQKDPILKNRSIISNIYAAPFTYISKSWGYYDPEVIQSGLIKINQIESLKLTKDFRYLWFNDSETNLAYQSPDIFICWLPNYSIEQFHQKKPRCGDYSFVQLARSRAGKKYNIVEYAKDASGEDKWSIILLKNFINKEKSANGTSPLAARKTGLEPLDAS